ncbi:MAG TPA: ribosome maturation factor RimP [Firmicutes bacterium]|nr:ribosome maturation factor RimP [Bacillota bacterium]
MSNIVEQTESIVLPICENNKVELVDVEYVKEGQAFFLRVYVDTPEGIDIDQCADVAEELSLKLDELDYISDEYILEVSSPGAERPLKTKDAILQSIGSYVNVRTYQAIEGKKEYEGYLTSFNDDIITVEIMIKTRKKSVEIPYDKVAKIRLAIKF